MVPEKTVGLGRIFVPDDRDRNFSIRRLASGVQRLPYKRWATYGKPLNQGQRPTCVAHAAARYLTNLPIRNKLLTPAQIETLYREAQALDEIPFSHDGTTARAAMKALQKRGQIRDYRWGWDIDTVLDYLLAPEGGGPALLGVNWYRGMSDPDEKGFINISGPIDGGHEVLLIAAHMGQEWVEGINSWGEWGGWGRYLYNGRFRIRFDALDRLMREDGDIVAGSEVFKPYAGP